MYKLLEENFKAYCKNYVNLEFSELVETSTVLCATSYVVSFYFTDLKEKKDSVLNVSFVDSGYNSFSHLPDTMRIQAIVENILKDINKNIKAKYSQRLVLWKEVSTTEREDIEAKLKSIETMLSYCDDIEPIDHIIDSIIMTLQKTVY